jgi:hypothetical protein
MTHWTEAAEMLDERDSAPQSVVARYAPGAFAFVMSAALGVYLVYLRPQMFASAPPPATPSIGKPDAFGGLAPVTPAPSLALAANPYGLLVTQGFEAPARFSLAEQEAAPLPPIAPPDLRNLAVADAPPLPPRRPIELVSPPLARPATVARLAPRATPELAEAAPAAPAAPGLFEKMFGGVGAPAHAPAKPQEQRLAYAAPPPVSTTSGLSVIAAGRGGAPMPGGFGGFLRGLSFNGQGPSTRYGDHVAVYDISARIVYLPDGTKLEAHSGLGEARDDPSSVNVRMRGATPPATYSLSPREALFHGVEALRLTPVDGSVYGRVGLLAHTYMLGPDGDSNGCISFRDYDAFLHAYRSGQISKLVVVTRL